MATTELTSNNPRSDITAQANTPKIVCRDVWKVFGDKAARFLAEHPSKPTYDELTEAGLIGAVRDVSLTPTSVDVIPSASPPLAVNVPS